MQLLLQVHLTQSLSGQHRKIFGNFRKPSEYQIFSLYSKWDVYRPLQPMLRWKTTKFCISLFINQFHCMGLQSAKLTQSSKCAQKFTKSPRKRPEKIVNAIFTAIRWSQFVEDNLFCVCAQKKWNLWPFGWEFLDFVNRRSNRHRKLSSIFEFRFALSWFHCWDDCRYIWQNNAIIWTIWATNCHRTPVMVGVTLPCIVSTRTVDCSSLK